MIANCVQVLVGYSWRSTAVNDCWWGWVVRERIRGLCKNYDLQSCEAIQALSLDWYHLYCIPLWNSFTGKYLYALRSYFNMVPYSWVDWARLSRCSGRDTFSVSVTSSYSLILLPYFSIAGFVAWVIQGLIKTPQFNPLFSGRYQWSVPKAPSRGGSLRRERKSCW